MEPTGGPRSLRRTSPMLLVAAMFVAAGGYIHLREWLTLYRHVPADSPGAAVVRIGFPVNAALSAVLALSLVVVAFRRSRASRFAVVAALTFEAVSLAVLVATRSGSVFGWTERVWTPGAEQTRAVEVGALIALVCAALLGLQDRSLASAAGRSGVSARRSRR